MLGKKLGLGSGRHLAAVLSPITSELRYPLGFLNQCLMFSHWISRWGGLAFRSSRLIELQCAQGDYGNWDEVLQIHFLMVTLRPI